MNYYDTIDNIKKVFEMDDDVATITHGNITDVDLENSSIYPLVHMTPSGVTLNERTKIYQFNIVVMDQLDFASGKLDDPSSTGIFLGVGNEQSVLAQCLFITERALTRLRRHEDFRNKNIVLSSFPNVTPFIGDYNNGCAGWTYTISLETPSGGVDNGIC